MPDNKEPKADFSDVEGGSSSTAPPAPSAARTHTVVKGDTLSKLAKQYYGNAGQWKRIYEANKDVIQNPDLIYPGQTFKIPEA
jgi:nucleoid-associated protein YgaU